MTVTPYGWAVVAFIFISIWICRKILRRYGSSLGCLGNIWLFMLVFSIGSFVVVFVPIVAGYILFAPEHHIITVVGSIFALIILVTSYYGILKYAFGGNMLSWIVNVRKFGLLVFVPALMIAFDALLIYAYFYGNVDALWVKISLSVFILVLSVAIPGYMKSMWADFQAGNFEPTDDAVKDEKERQRKKRLNIRSR